MVLTDVSEVVSYAYNKVTEKGLLNPNLNPTLNPTLTPVALCAYNNVCLVCEVRWDVVAPSVRLYSCSTKVEVALALDAHVASRRSIAGCVWGVYNPVNTPSKLHAHRRHVEERLKYRNENFGRFTA